MLKKCLLGLFVGFVGLLSFSNAGSYIYSGSSTSTNYTSSSAISFPIRLTKSPSAINFTLDCTFNGLGSSLSVNVYGHGINSSKDYGEYKIGTLEYNGGNLTVNPNSANFLTVDSIDFRVKQSSTFTYSCVISGARILGDCPECEECQECSEVDTGVILSGSCDINYCVENGLCPTSSGSRSELKINDIVHEGKPLINISIPDYIYWDYVTDENQFDLYVGSGYNQDYIDSILAINSYRPDNEDFTNIFVSGLTLIFPYIFVALLIVFIWKLLKRIFK